MTYLLLTLQIMFFQITIFIESTLRDVFVYQEGAFTYFFHTQKDRFSQVDVTTKISDSMMFKYFEFI